MAFTVKQRRYLQERLKGKNKKLAALIAGYSESTAENALHKIETPVLRERFSRLARVVLPEEKLVLRLAEGLDATITKVVTHEGEVTDYVECVDYDQRRKYIELVAEFAQYVMPRGTQTNVGLNVPITVTVEHIASEYPIPTKTK